MGLLKMKTSNTNLLINKNSHTVTELRRPACVRTCVSGCGFVCTGPEVKGGEGVPITVKPPFQKVKKSRKRKAVWNLTASGCCSSTNTCYEIYNYSNELETLQLGQLPPRNVIQLILRLSLHVKADLFGAWNLTGRNKCQPWSDCLSTAPTGLNWGHVSLRSSEKKKKSLAAPSFVFISK